MPPILAQHYVADSFPGIPPDNYMAISKGNKSVSVMNSNIAVHNGLTGQMLYRKSLKSFSSAAGLNNIFYDYRYDPKIIYDPGADRYICVMLNGTDDRNFIVLAFSKTNDPAGLWNFYKLYGNYSADTTWFDYPSIAITEKEFFLTGNKIKFYQSWQAGFSQSLIYQINKQSGYDGASSLTYQIWDSIGFNGVNIRNLFPVKGGGAINGPEQYFLSNRNFDVQNDTVFLIKLPDTIGSSNTSLTLTPLVSSLPYGVPPQGRQPDTSAELATNDGRILGAYREGNQIQFVSTTVHPASGSSGVYHGIISDFATTPSVQANYFSIDSLDFGYPNISFAGNYSGVNHSIISFEYTGPQDFPGMGAIYQDGSQFSDMLVVKSGDSSIKQLGSKSQRWGDYTGSQPDWNQIGAVWIEGIFGNKHMDYGNYMAKLVSPFYSSVSGSPSVSDASVFPNPASHFLRFEFQLAKDEGVIFGIYDMQGRLVDNILESKCKAGRNRIEFNTARLAPGTYLLKAQSQAGNAVFTEKFVKE
ncbi:MAG: T9SS type A sorting domain-containing protein [Sphingobacteriales bacterium]|nr:MAG: T9SS type A sorting domain-containing protein [Sphingobacteriales bacterium]